MDSTMVVNNLYVIATVIGGIGLFMFSRLKFIPKVIRGVLGVTLLAVAILAGGLGYELSQYGHTDEQLLGRVEFSEVDDQHYVAMIHLSDETKHYELKGDEWQLDARVLAWQTNYLPDTSYQFSRLSGRYSDLDQEQTNDRTVYEVNNSGAVVDLWQLIKSNGAVVNWVSAYQGSSVYMPMQDKALYSISLGKHGLIARPENTEAEAALQQW